jgi:hypothetical protein
VVVAAVVVSVVAVDVAAVEVTVGAEVVKAVRAMAVVDATVFRQEPCRPP